MFKHKIINKFLLHHFISNVGLVLLIVCGIVFAITFIERLPSNPTALDSLYESWIRLLEYVPLFLPIATFMATLLTSYNLTKSSENIVISGAGLSPYQSSLPFFYGTLLLGIIATSIINPYSVNLSTANLGANNLQLIDNTIWLHENTDNGFTTFSAKQIEKNKNNLILKEVLIYDQDSSFKLKSRIKADTVTLSDNLLTIRDANILNSDGSIQQKKDITIKSNLTPQTVLDRYLQSDQISFWTLPKFIHKMESIGVPMRAHRVQFWTLLFLPLTMLSMTILGIAFSQTRQRRTFNFGLKFGFGIITCFITYFIINMFNAFGTTGIFPPLLSVITPPMIIIAVSGTFIAKFDTL